MVDIHLLSMVDIHLLSMVDIHLRKLLRVKGNDRADRLAGKATFTSDLLLGRSELLRSLRHYKRAQNQGHHTTDCLEERGVERESARRSSMKGRERYRQSDEHWKRFKGDVVGISERRGGAHMGFSERIDTI